VSGQHKVNLKIVCKENFKYEVQEKSPANQAVTMQQLAEEYWRWASHHIALLSLELSHIGQMPFLGFPNSAKNPHQISQSMEL
jgi:hypothetical protein